MLEDTKILLELNSFVQEGIESNDSKKDKVRISPIGKAKGIDGRIFFIDSKKVIENTKNNGVHLVLDKNHEDSEAMGWFDINSLEEREDGIYASLELTQAGKDLIQNKSFRYLSPSFSCRYKDNEKMREVDFIGGVGLVNRPNLTKESLNSLKKQGEEMEKNQQDITLELNKRVFELNEENKTLLTQKEELNKRIEALSILNKELEKNAREQRIDALIKVGELLPSRKQIALSFESSALDSFLDVCKAEAISVLKKSDININELNASSDDGIEKKIKDQLGL